jgi:N-methylhydantoinase B
MLPRAAGAAANPIRPPPHRVLVMESAGLLRPIRVIAPGNVETSQRITAVILGALARALPERIPAASSGTMGNLSFGGWDTSRNKAFADCFSL